MPSFSLRLTGLIVATATVVVACISPATVTIDGAYPAIVKVLSGAIALAGSLCLTAAISRTFLRSGGINAFKAAYVAAMALSGVGLAEALSAFQPVNMCNVLMAYCVVSVASGVMWRRFYAHSA